MKILDKIKRYLNRNEIVDYPLNSSWMLNEDLSPDTYNIWKCKQFRKLSTINHSARWHKEGDPLKHTLRVANEMHRRINTPEYAHFNEGDKRVLMVAALCHDLGKIPTTYWDEKNNDWACKNHGAEGERMTRDMLFNEPIAFREEVCWLVRKHMIFHYFLMKGTEQEQKERLKELSRGQSTIEKLLLLNICDMTGSINEDNNEATINERKKRIADMADEVLCYDSPAPELHDRDNFKAYIMIGLPGSGKNTWIERNLPDTVNSICRDDIREEIAYGNVIGRKLLLSKKDEDLVTRVVNERIELMCKRKMDFVINQTSLKRKYRDDLKETIRKHGNPKIIYVYVEPPSLDDCHARRIGEIDWAIIQRMWNGFDFPDKSECDELIIHKQTS